MSVMLALALAAASVWPPTIPAIASAEPLTIAGSVPSMSINAASVPTGEEEWWTEDDWTWVDKAPIEAETNGGEKSVWKAIGASALLPGLGETYAGHPDRAKFFYAAEAAIWTTFGIFRVQASQRKERSIEYAEVNGGAPGDGDSDYYEHIGFWLSIDEWHDIVRRDARAAYPDDPAAQEAYFQEFKRYDESDSWNWEDDDTRLRYRQLRSESESAYRNARLAVGAAVLNRLVSMADALALTRKHNKNLRSEGVRLEFRISPESTVDGLVIGPVLSAEY